MINQNDSLPIRWARVALCFGLGAALVGCSSETIGGGASTSSSSGGETPDGGSDAGPGDPNVLVGSFQVRLVAPVPAMNGAPATPGQTAVVGKIYDGPTPSSLVWEEAQKEGNCKLVTPRVPFCNTPCGGSAVCVEDDTCKPYPAAHNAGTVTAKGIKTEAGAAEFAMSPVANAYQPPAGVKLAYPGFAEGDAITLDAAGEFFAPFSIASTGIAQLELTNTSIPLESGKPVALTWKPASSPTASKVHVKLDISHHGGTKGMIECDADDTGSLELPAALVTKLLDLGIAGYPSVIVTRLATGSTTISAGRVDLVVSADVERFVDIAGLTSCTGDMDCPSGQTCQADLTCK